ncbi:hypothetical protein C2G38_2152125 [Gigaspora rosea]|uniref:Uncharacterized protein n=1 Tax=Gigaspora rosea TaxID=44941 RepID=A0A397W985_9GLOM|nr:hypothetical protein C2G38_2152125 [Gigaspora rosea]
MYFILGVVWIMIIGLDISLHQPTHVKPKNFEFIKANAQERLPLDDNTFYFIFQRLLFIGYTNEKCYVKGSFPIDGGPATQYLCVLLIHSDEEFDESVKTMEKELFENNSYNYWVRTYGRKVNDNN